MNEEVASLSLSGKAFQSIGALTTKALSPSVTSQDFGTAKRDLSEDFRLRAGS